LLYETTSSKKIEQNNNSHLFRILLLINFSFTSLLSNSAVLFFIVQYKIIAKWKNYNDIITCGWPSTQITLSGQGTSVEKLFIIYPAIRIQWNRISEDVGNFSMNFSLVQLSIVNTWHINIPKEKFRLIFAMEILLETNAECTQNFSHWIIPTFYLIFSNFSKEFFLWKSF
jgi:hypothetical protein